MKELLKKRDNATSKETKIPLASTYNQSLTNISKVFPKYWNILSVNKSFKQIFQNEPVTAFKSNKNLKGTNRQLQSRVQQRKKYASLMKKGKCSPYSVNNVTLCCKQATSLSTFKRQQTKESYTIFHNVNCSSPCSLLNGMYLIQKALHKKIR